MKREEVEAKALEIQALLKENLLLPPEKAKNAMRQARALRRELLQEGYYVKSEYDLSLETHELTVHITVYKVRKNLPPELQKKYDQLFARMINIEDPEI